METMSAFADALLGAGAPATTRAGDATARADPIARAPPRGVTRVTCERTGYVMTKPFEANNPMPEAFDQTCEYIVAMLKPVTVSYTHLTLPTKA